MTCVTIPTNPEFQWLSHQHPVSKTHTKTNHANLTPRTPELARFTIQELIQQECCIGSADYPVDRPSRLVQIECRKPGCRCVLKNEFALALKIIPGVTLVQGEWIAPNALIHDKQQQQQYAFCSPGSNQRSTLTNLLGQPAADGEFSNRHVVLTSCCPSWFELVHRSLTGPKDSGPYYCPDVPVWSSGKAIWHAKPQFVLLRKEACCMFATKAQPFVTSSTDLLKKEDRSYLTLDADNPGQLRAGTVLRLLDCRLCRLTHKDGLDSLNSYRLIARHRSKPVSMLQFAVVGDKALAAVASSITTIQSQDALKWFADGPRLIYLPLDSKSILASPVYFPVPLNGSNQTSTTATATTTNMATECRTSNQGVHSLLSLLSSYQIPLVTRPIIGLRPNEMLFVGRPAADSNAYNQFEPVSSAQQPLLHLFACHHGDLIFLEPLSECAGPICYPATTTNRNHPQLTSSRFFVVTPDMLAHHNFLVADEETCQAHSRELETHALRVSHFLAACHPAQGLGYLLKHLEDTTHSSSLGPSHTPLTRTLGPISNQMSTVAFQAALASVAAVAALASGKHDTLPSDHLNEIQSDVLNHMLMSASSTDVSDMYRSASCLGGNSNHFTRSSISSSLLASEADEMNALCDEIEDIYFYVRNGHFPAHSRSMSSLPHQQQQQQLQLNSKPDSNMPQASAPMSPKIGELSSAGNRSANQKRRLQSLGDILTTAVKTSDNRLSSTYQSKVTSKAPVVMIRPSPIDQGLTRTKVSMTSPVHNGTKFVPAPIQSPNNGNYDCGIRFTHNPQQITLSPRQPVSAQSSRTPITSSTHTGYLKLPANGQNSNGVSSPRTAAAAADKFSPSRIRTSPYVTTARERGLSIPGSETSPFLVVPTMIQSSGHVGLPSADHHRTNQSRLVSYPYLGSKPNLTAPALMATSVNLMLNRPADRSYQHPGQGVTATTCDTGTYYVRGHELDQTRNPNFRPPILSCESNDSNRRHLSLSTSHLCPVNVTNGIATSTSLTKSTNPSMNHTPELGRTGSHYLEPDELLAKGLSFSQNARNCPPDVVSQISSQYTNVVQQPNLVKWVNVPPSMPLLHHQSRLCQSTVIDCPTPKTPDLPDPRMGSRSKQGSVEQPQPQQQQPQHVLNSGTHYTMIPTSLKTTHPVQSPNSSPDTGIGGDSACDHNALGRPNSRNATLWTTSASAPYCASSNQFILTPVHVNPAFVTGTKQRQVYQF